MTGAIEILVWCPTWTYAPVALKTTGNTMFGNELTLHSK